MSKQHQSEIHKTLWKIANDLRGNSGIEPFEFKNYILGIIFYKFLSEKIEDEAAILLENDNITFKQAWHNAEYHEDLRAELVENIGYVIQPDYLFSTMVNEINRGSEGVFDVELLQKAVTELTLSTKGEDSEDDFDNLFDDMDLNSARLGKTVAERSSFMKQILLSINTISFRHEDVEIDVLGDAYEYMISQFAASAGKKAGEFYTPQQVSTILAKIVSDGKTRLKSVYDPTCGSGSLLLRVSKQVDVAKYYGQELTSTTYNLARMNMMLHGVPYQRFDLYNGNTLLEPHHIDKKFEAIVANPPYSANWNPNSDTLSDERYNQYGKLAPSSKADFAFIQHMLHQLDGNGTMAVVLPHGVLFRGAAEGTIRKHIIEKLNYLDAVIGLPANIFFGTSIPTAILVFKKNRKPEDGILFVDASTEFEKGKNQNSLTDANVEKIFDTYHERKAVDKFSALVSLADIGENDYNLNIPRYVDSSITEDVIELDIIASKILIIDARLKELTNNIENQLANINAKMMELQ